MNIILLGYRATGKSSLGEALAKELGYGFFDVDYEIEKSEGMSIAELINKKGEEKFREVEKEMIKRIDLLENFVVGTGGGAVMSSSNRQIISKNSFNVWLSTNPSIIFSRVKSSKVRPILTNYDSYHEILVLLKKREPFYKDLCHLEIDTGDNDVSASVSLIKKAIERMNYEG
jgi:shikimate kinase